MRLTRIALLLNFAIAGYTHALVLDLGVANEYNGFFFADVNTAAYVEGRLAVGGNLNAGFDVGYRNAHDSSAPSLVVAGNVLLSTAWGKAGIISNGPVKNIDTNTSIGLSPAIWVSKGPNRPNGLQMGDLVYGGKLNAASWQYATAIPSATVINFAAAKIQLSALSKKLAQLPAIGQWRAEAEGLVLSGNGQSDLQVFNLGDTAITNVYLKNIKPDAHIIINSTLSKADFSGHYGGEHADSADTMAKHRDRIIWNLSHARQINISRFVNGSVLAVNADVIGSGHIEGTLIANSLSNGNLEIGYEPFKSITMPSLISKPEFCALISFGLASVIMGLRRKKKSKYLAELTDRAQVNTLSGWV
ncbi:choice-of-anchor A family protein [Iodobacter fluviatilis]|uniref:Choice-of-anchor A domain n=1 Tax=Iodobacter fluviatilis TaxID=537 RepID=A0A377Q4J9_9NEIS|nr:choice-of-anchor A family protein [Iodobacter fluviatilis]TCU84075.1 choice-of-anchor A domain-containing protein [Iodobacter fluviatilis]STQ89688.1 choice-of-anchor A domain [Iodobacter fluviatilis]